MVVRITNTIKKKEHYFYYNVLLIKIVCQIYTLLKGDNYAKTITDFSLISSEVTIEDFDISQCFKQEFSKFYALKFNNVEQKDFKTFKGW